MPRTLVLITLAFVPAACVVEDSTGEVPSEIVDGWAASPAIAESIARVTSLSDAGTYVGCTGTLVAPRWVATALHCVTGGKPYNTWVRIGPDNEYRDVTAIRLAPPDVAGEWVPRDMVLLRLKSPSAHAPIPIAEPWESSAWTAAADQNLYAIAAGWGQINVTTGTTFLRQTTVKIDHTDPAWDPAYGRHIQVSRGIGNVCFGDSGSPLLIARADGSYAVAGVLSAVAIDCSGFGNYGRIADGRNGIWARRQLRGTTIDFDANGISDAFTAEPSGGVQQYYASAGALGSWLPLAYSSQGLGELRFGDFDGDGVTDLFTTTPSGGYHQWWYSKGGVSSWTALAYASESLASLRFGDLDGDGITDVFAAVPRAGGGYQWRYSSGGAGGWVDLAWDYASPGDLGLADFDGDGITDVFTAELQPAGWYRWKYSPGGAGPYVLLASAYQSVADVRFGDFDDDGRSDVFAAIPTAPGVYQWYYSSAGAGAYAPLATATDSVSAVRIGDFNGDSISDVFTVHPAAGSFQQRYYSAGGRSSWAALGWGFEPLASLRIGELYDQR